MNEELDEQYNQKEIELSEDCVRHLQDSARRNEQSYHKKVLGESTKK